MSRAFKLNKIVRDNIVEDMRRRGQHVASHRLTDEAYGAALDAKLVEEATEVAACREDPLDELADLLEVIEARAQHSGHDYYAVRERQLLRGEQRGGFAGRLFVSQVTLTDDDPWVDYYAADPARYPEVRS